MSRGHFPVSPHSSRVDQQTALGTGNRDTPSRNRQKPIPLPVLADVPIIIHPLLAYSHSMLPIKYDLITPPATALLEPSMRSQPAFLRWRYHAAMEPSTIGSITIRIMEFDKPVVVLPSGLDTNIVTIEDVLNSVYYATNTGAREAHYDGILDDPFQLWSQQQVPVQGQGVRRCRLCGRGSLDCRQGHWWGGLYASRDERDVWILHIGREDRQ
ncbi:hypothetical protein BDZ97DRAFT_1765071 [Flammula alnicola]|nr:hypothetical protein BDZ97DRAFT_1765071 [Flammula alnicola]